MPLLTGKRGEMRTSIGLPRGVQNTVENVEESKAGIFTSIDIQAFEIRVRDGFACIRSLEGIVSSEYRKLSKGRQPELPPRLQIYEK